MSGAMAASEHEVTLKNWAITAVAMAALYAYLYGWTVLLVGGAA
jgi:hypothetical protein